MGVKPGKRKGSVASNVPAEKDDGTRWIVVRDGVQVYLGSGVTRRQAEHLATGLVETASLIQVA